MSHAEAKQAIHRSGSAGEIRFRLIWEVPAARQVAEFVSNFRRPSFGTLRGGNRRSGTRLSNWNRACFCSADFLHTTRAASADAGSPASSSSCSATSERGTSDCVSPAYSPLANRSSLASTRKSFAILRGDRGWRNPAPYRNAQTRVASRSDSAEFPTASRSDPGASNTERR